MVAVVLCLNETGTQIYRKTETIFAKLLPRNFTEGMDLEAQEALLQ